MQRYEIFWIFINACVANLQHIDIGIHTKCKDTKSFDITASSRRPRGTRQKIFSTHSFVWECSHNSDFCSSYPPNPSKSSASPVCLGLLCICHQSPSFDLSHPYSSVDPILLQSWGYLHLSFFFSDTTPLQLQTRLVAIMVTVTVTQMGTSPQRQVPASLQLSRHHQM